jgi:hypothetical protein
MAQARFGRTVAAFVALAAGLLVHYSAGPYVAFLALHYLFRFFRERPWRWRELAGVTVAAGLLLATWFAWSVKVYGAKTTFGSNTSVTFSQQYQGSNLEKIALNLYDSIVPGAFRGQPQTFPQANPDGYTRDVAFVWYQLNLVFGMGTVSGLVVLWLLYRRLVRGNALREKVFWRWMVPFCVVVGIAVVGERDPNGVPHLTLLSIEVLGLTWLAANFRHFPQSVQFLLIAACCVDFYFGVFLEARMESLENNPGLVEFPDPRFVGGRFFFAGDGPGLSAKTPGGPGCSSAVPRCTRNGSGISRPSTPAIRSLRGSGRHRRSSWRTAWRTMPGTGTDGGSRMATPCISGIGSREHPAMASR